MSATPRTDALEEKLRDCGDAEYAGRVFLFMRKLEKEGIYLEGLLFDITEGVHTGFCQTGWKEQRHITCKKCDAYTKARLLFNGKDSEAILGSDSEKEKKEPSGSKGHSL